MRKQELVRALERVPAHPDPKPEWEQYATPAAVAAELLWLAEQDGQVRGRRILDLGCGTGTFALGAMRLGAASVLGVDVDERAVQVAQRTALAWGVHFQAQFVAADLRSWHAEPGAFDTAIMNPPFGAQKDNRHADRVFYDRASEAVGPAGTVWFLAQEGTERFLTAYAAELGRPIERVAVWDYPLPAQFTFHGKPVHSLRVGGYRFGPQDNAV